VDGVRNAARGERKQRGLHFDPRMAQLYQQLVHAFGNRGTGRPRSDDHPKAQGKMKNAEIESEGDLRWGRQRMQKEEW
jgi:hypothetical protein